MHYKGFVVGYTLILHLCGLFHSICSYELNLSATESAFTIIPHYQPTKGQDSTTFRVYRQPSSVAMHVEVPIFCHADIYHHRVSTYYIHIKHSLL